MSYILLVEDNRFVSTCVSVALEKENYQVRTAENGIEALSIVEEEIPEGIICDVNMPHMNGYTFIRTLRESAHTRHIPVIIYTSNRDEKEKELFHQLGVAFYVDKRADRHILLHALRICCG